MSYITIETCQARIDELNKRISGVTSRYSVSQSQRDSNLTLIDKWTGLTLITTKLTNTGDVYNYIKELDDIDSRLISYNEEINSLQARMTVMNSNQ